MIGHEVRLVDLFHQGAFKDYIQGCSGQRLTAEEQRYLKEAKAAEALRDLLEQSPGRNLNRRSSPMRVFTAMHSSPPHTVGGYTSRAHGLISALKNAGITIQPHTRPGYLQETQAGRLLDEECVYTTFDGVAYRHLVSESLRKHGEYQYMLGSVDGYRRAMLEYQPSVVHLRSTYLVSLPALVAARQLGIPTVYEVSGLWELVYEGRGQSSLANRTRILETLTMKHADQIATLTAAMKDLIIARGISGDRVSRVPNAVDPGKFGEPTEVLGLPGLDGFSSEGVCVGYAGSAVDYEGLDDLLQAIKIVNTSKPKLLRAIIVGDGAELPRLKELSDELGLGNQVAFTGRVSSSLVASYYSLFEICALPRKRTPATDVVSPLKPFEIMVSGRPMVVSDTPALKEISGHGAFAAIARSGDPVSLAECLASLASDPDGAQALANSARSFVLREHTWERVGGLMAEVLQRAAETPFLHREAVAC